MKTVRKVLGLILVAAMVLSMTACGGASNKVTKVQLLTWSNAATVEYLKSIAEDFHKEYPQYELEVTEVPSGEIDQVIQTRIIAGDVDIVSFQTFSKPQEDWNKNQIDKPAWQEYIDNGQLLELTDKAFINNFNKNTLMGNAYNGKLYSVSVATVAYTGLFYNKAIFEELGLEVPKTWDEFIAVCEAVKADGKYNVLSAGAGDQWPLNMFSNAIISANYQDDAKEFGQKILTGEIKHTDPESMLIYDCMEQFGSYMEDGVAGVAYSDAPGRFASGNLAMYADGAWSAGDIKNAGANFEFGYFPLPGVAPRADGLDPQYGIKYDLSFSVPTKAPNQDGAIAFLDYFSKKDVYTGFVNATGMTPTEDGIVSENEFLNSLTPGLQAPCLNAEMYMFSPKGVGEYGANQYSFFNLTCLGGQFTGAELAEAADADFQAAFDAAAGLAD